MMHKCAKEGEGLGCNDEELRLMVRIAYMYYEKDITQDQIAKELGIYRTTISRSLKK